MDTSAPIPNERLRTDERRPVAPVWHTVVFIVVVLGFSLTQASRVHEVQTHSRFTVYAYQLLVEFVLFAYIWLLGTRRSGTRVRDLIGGKWVRWTDPFRDVGVAFVFWLVVVAALVSMRFLLGDNQGSLGVMKAMSPRTVPEGILWIFVSSAAGFCEEFMFRGYLQRQFLAWTGSAGFAIVAQAVIFGVGHLYQGWKGALTITVYGALFGLLAAVRKSLRPGIIQHAAQDSFTGILIGLLMKYGKI
jgi:uncharacterized protein